MFGNAHMINPDAELEARIAAALTDYAREGSGPTWLRLVELIGQRSPEQVKRMERAKGLR